MQRSAHPLGQIVQLAIVKHNPPMPSTDAGRKMMLTRAAVAILLLVAVPAMARADAVADFYRGRTISLLVGPYAMARPFVAPPGVPADRAAALQAAFVAVHRDEEFIAEAARLKIEVDAISGEAVLRAIDRITAAPADVVAALRHLLADRDTAGAAR
jgi:hypothetical protein